MSAFPLCLDAATLLCSHLLKVDDSFHSCLLPRIQLSLQRLGPVHCLLHSLSPHRPLSFLSSPAAWPVPHHPAFLEELVLFTGHVIKSRQPERKRQTQRYQEAPCRECSVLGELGPYWSHFCSGSGRDYKMPVTIFFSK